MEQEPALKRESLEHGKKEGNVETVSATSVIDYGGDSSLPPPPQLSAEQEKKLYRKIDLWLMPILTLMYLFAFLDRGASTELVRATAKTNRSSAGNIGKRV